MESAKAVRNFHMAAIRGDAEILRNLLNSGSVDANAKNKSGLTALYYTLSRKDGLDVHHVHTEMMKMLIHAGADVRTIGKFGRTALHLAASRNDCTFIEDLLSRGADINARDDHNQTPLHYCRTHKEAAELLLKNGADVNAQDNLGDTPFMKAGLDMYEFYSNYNADFNLKNNIGNSPLKMATNSGNLKVIRLLVDHGSNVNDVSNFEMTPLHIACRVGDPKIVGFLIESGANVNALDYEGATPLHEACGRVYVDKLGLRLGNFILHKTLAPRDIATVVQILLNNGADIDAVDLEGEAPLNKACMDGELEVIKLLLMNSAKINLIGFESFSSTYMYLEKLEFMLKYLNVNSIYFTLRNVISPYGNSVPDKNTRPVLEHLAKLHVLKLPLDQCYYDLIEKQGIYSDYFRKCVDELKVAKNTKIEKCWITFLNLLLDGKKKLKNYAGNEDLIGKFKESNCLSKFPIYGAAMNKNIEKGIKRRELFDESSIFLSYVLPILNPNHLIVRDTLDCITSTKDLLVFLKKNPSSVDPTDND